MLADTDDPTLDSAHLPKDADALYTEGMVHYRRREWNEAKACFMRLKSIAPDYRGIDPLLNEVDIFIQLQAMQPERQEMAIRTGEEGLQAKTAAQPRVSTVQGMRRRSPWLTVAITLVVLMTILVALYATGAASAIIDNQRQVRVHTLINQGRAALNVGDYDRAVKAFGEALTLAPSNDEVKTWYAKAQRYQQLTTLCAQVETDIATQDWDSALEKVNRISALDPTYCDASEKKDFLEKQKALQALFDEAKRYLEQDNWNEAITTLEQLREQAPTFKTSEVQQTLSYAYFQKGVELMATAGECDLDLIGQAIQSFDQALTIFPNDKTASEEKQLADLYRRGCLFFSQKDWPQAVIVLQQIYSIRPDYVGGRVASMLCTSYLRLGDAYHAAGDLEQALQQYRNVLAIESCDHVEAAVKEREVYVALYPPTPTPTSTPIPTRTPRPTPTWTATPVPLPPPPPPATPIPRR